MKRKFPSFREFLRTDGEILLESEEVLNEFEKEFPRSIVRADPSERPLEVTEENMRKIFNVLNKMIFKDKIEKIKLFSGNNSKIIGFLNAEFNENISEKEMSNHLGFHVVIPIEDKEKNRYVISSNEVIVFNTTYGKSSFGYAVSIICHEMMHCYDFHCGDALKYSYVNRQYGLNINLHRTSVFKYFMTEIPDKYDIPVFIDGNGKSYIELNEEAQKYFLSLKESLSSQLSEDENRGNNAVIQHRSDGSTFIMDVIKLNPNK